MVGGLAVADRVGELGEAKQRARRRASRKGDEKRLACLVSPRLF
jgi:hypothetical protein